MPRATTSSKLASGAQSRSSIRPTRTRRCACSSPRWDARRRRVSAAIASEASIARTSKPRRARKSALRPPAQPRSSTRTTLGSGKPATSPMRRTSGARAAKRATFSGDSQKSFTALAWRPSAPLDSNAGNDPWASTCSARPPCTASRFYEEFRFLRRVSVTLPVRSGNAATFSPTATRVLAYSRARRRASAALRTRPVEVKGPGSLGRSTASGHATCCETRQKEVPMKRIVFVAVFALMGALCALAQPTQNNEKTVAQLQAEMAAGKLTSVDLTNYYITRIRTLDQKGSVNSVIELNPDALAMAKNADDLRRNGIVLGPLHGIPVLLKDNIDTGDKMQTTAGSFALFGAPATQDSTVAANLRAGGAVILGKTNLSEWANFRSFESTSGWSGL